MENLNVKGMMVNKKLARAISDVGFYKIKKSQIQNVKQTSINTRS